MIPNAIFQSSHILVEHFIFTFKGIICIIKERIVDFFANTVKVLIEIADKSLSILKFALTFTNGIDALEKLDERFNTLCE